MEMTVCYEAAVAHARSRPLPPPAFFTLPNISGPSIAEDLPRMAAKRSCEGGEEASTAGTSAALWRRALLNGVKTCGMQLWSREEHICTER